MKSIWPSDLVKALYALIGPPDKNGCREWLGDRHPKGYGVFRYKGKVYQAHKLYLCIQQNIAYVHKKDMSVKMDAAHNCPSGIDNPSCVIHAEWMDSKQHAADRVVKGQLATGDKNGSRLHPEKMARGDKHGSHTHPEKVARGDKHGSWQHPEKVAMGAKNGRAKLIEPDVIKMLALYVTGNWTITALANEFHVTYNTVRRIVMGVNWKHVK